MTRFKQIIFWLLVISAGLVGVGLVCLTRHAPRPGEPGYVPRPGDPKWVWERSVPRLTRAQGHEWEIMRINLASRSSSFYSWHAGLARAMLQKANWLANRLNLPIRRPIDTTDIQGWDTPAAWHDILPQPMPSHYPDTVFGTDIFNTNFSRLQRIFALKFGLNGYIDTPPYEFSFMDGQLMDLARMDSNESDRAYDRLTEMMTVPHVHPPPLKTAEIYQIATNYLATVGINLDMLEKSRLPYPVRQEEHLFPGATQPQPIYSVTWGTNFYYIDWIYHFWHTNYWHPAVMVEIGPNKELLELSVGDPTYYRDPPTLIPSKTVWRLVHTPDPIYPDFENLTNYATSQQLTNPAIEREYIISPAQALNWMPTEEKITNSTYWQYKHHLLDPVTTMDISNFEAQISPELIPYTNTP